MNHHTFIEEEDGFEPLTFERVAPLCYKNVKSFLQTSHHYLEQRSTDVIHLVEKLEKFEK